MLQSMEVAKSQTLLSEQMNNNKNYGPTTELSGPILKVLLVFRCGTVFGL